MELEFFALDVPCFGAAWFVVVFLVAFSYLAHSHAQDFDAVTAVVIAVGI